jgi:uncharacterized radical SAM superfamily Fe-S cluster-containing enzyme
MEEHKVWVAMKTGTNPPNLFEIDANDKVLRLHVAPMSPSMEMVQPKHNDPVMVLKNMAANIPKPSGDEMQGSEDEMDVDDKEILVCPYCFQKASTMEQMYKHKVEQHRLRLVYK